MGSSEAVCLQTRTASLHTAFDLDESASSWVSHAVPYKYINTASAHEMDARSLQPGQTPTSSSPSLQLSYTPASSRGRGSLPLSANPPTFPAALAMVSESGETTQPNTKSTNPFSGQDGLRRRVDQHIADFRERKARTAEGAPQPQSLLTPAWRRAYPSVRGRVARFTPPMPDSFSPQPQLGR